MCNQANSLARALKKRYADEEETETGLIEEEKKLEPIHWEIIDEAYITAARVERARMRNAMLPASACASCTTPTCCTGTLVPVTGAEAALIVKVHRDLIEEKKQEILSRVGRSHGYSLRCPFQCEESGKCLVHDVSPWNCAMYFVSSLEDPSVCNYAVQKRAPRAFTEGSGERMKYGKISMAGVTRVIEEARKDSDTIGVGYLDTKYLPDVIVEIMARLEPDTWGEAWRHSHLNEMLA